MKHILKMKYSININILVKALEIETQAPFNKLITLGTNLESISATSTSTSTTKKATHNIHSSYYIIENKFHDYNMQIIVYCVRI